jgi:hypothetical protein
MRASGKGARAAAVAALLVCGLLARPAAASVPGDIGAGLPPEQVIANGIEAGLTLETILAQALEADAQPEEIVKAAVTLKLDLAQVFKALLDRGVELELLMRAAVAAGVDVVETANAAMAAGAELEEVRRVLALLDYPGAETYTYTPPGPPTVLPLVAPAFPGVGGGGVASPAR